MEQHVRQARVLAFAGAGESSLLGDALGGDVGREGEGDDLFELEVAGEFRRGQGGLRGDAVSVQVWLDGPGELDRRLAFDRRQGEAATAGEPAALALDEDPGSEAVLVPVPAVVQQQLAE
jgi:hypothetical protein